MQEEIRLKLILKKIIAILCMFVMVFYFLPMNVFADEIREQIQETNDMEITAPYEEVEEVNELAQNTEKSSQDYKTKIILQEEVDKRKANEKHYILEDGTRVVAMFPANIHYKQDGKFVDVDNTLEAKKDTKEALKLTEKQLQEELQAIESEEKVQVQEEQKQEEIVKNQKQTGLEQIEKQNQTIGVQTDEQSKITEQTNQIEETNQESKEAEEIQINPSIKIAQKTKEQILESYELAKETKVYENKSNSYKTKFTNKTKGYYLGSLVSEGNTITWRLKNAKSTNLNVKNPKSNTKINEFTTIEDIQISQASSMIEYKSILQDISINYVLEPEIIKENIILENKNAINNKLVFEYETNGLEMKLLDNHEIIVYKENEKDIKFKIQAPFMYDSKLEFSNKIDLSLKKKNGRYELTLVPDKEWLQSEERQYPITIDPTIQTSLYYQNIKDTFTYKGDTNNTNRYQAHILRIGNGMGQPFRSLIKFTLPTLKSGDQVIAAELGICNYPDTNEWNPPTEERIVDVHKVTANWTDSTANWSNTSTNFDSKITDHIRYKYDKNNTKKENRFDITTIVKDWYTTGKNYGVMLKEHTEFVSENGTDMYFLSADTNSSYIDYRPKVIIAYRNQTGLEDYLSYHSQSVGRAGTIYTNDYNGNLTLIHTDASTPGNRLPVTVEHVYNTNEKDTDIGYGKGMRLNLSQTLEQMTISSKEYLKYTDEDATAHYLLKNTKTNAYEDEDGLGLVAKASDTSMVMTDKAGNTMTFQKYSGVNKWHLKQIKDTNNNTITLSLTGSGSNYLITQAQDAAGDKITLTYESGRLQKITDVAGRNTTYAYDSTYRLTSITYPDNKKSIYTYGSKNELTKAQNIDKSYITYSYYPGLVYRVKAISEYGTDGTQGKSLTITYGNNLTNFKDNKGYSNTYTFDNYGHAISIADFGKADQNINNAYGKAYQYGTSGNSNNKLTLESKLISVKDVPNNLVVNPNFDNGLTGWTKNGQCEATEKVVTVNNSNVLEIKAKPDKSKGVYQVIRKPGKKGDIFTMYGWIRTLGIPNRQTKEYTRLTLIIYNTDGENEYINVPITPGTDAWQFVSKTITMKKDYRQVEFRLEFYCNANYAQFGNVGLFKEEFGQSYQYDQNGNLVTSQDLAKQNSTFMYSGNNDLLQNVNPRGGKFVYEYDYLRKGRLLKALDIQGTKYSFGYSSHGNTTSVKVEEGDKTDKLQSGKTYFVKSAYSGKYFDMKGNSAEDDVVLQQYRIATTKNQNFKFEEIAGDPGYYRITPELVTTKALYYDEADAENRIKQRPFQNIDTFKWKLTENSNGTYRIENKAKPNYVITIKNESTDHSVAFELAEWEGKLTQQVYLYDVSKREELGDKDYIESNEVYYIRSKTTNQYLTIENEDEKPYIVQRKFKEKEPKQLWRIVRENTNVYRLISLDAKEGEALYVVEHENVQDKSAAAKPYEGITPQKWRIMKNTNDTYTIQTMISGTTRALRTLDNSKTEGARIVINTSGDQYYLEKANMVEDFEEGATYTIKERKRGIYLGVNGTNIEQQPTFNNQDTQKWILYKEAGGYYSFRSASDPTKTMDVLNGGTANRTNLQIKTRTGADSEKFEIVPRGNGAYTVRPKVGKGRTCVDLDEREGNNNVSTYVSGTYESEQLVFTKVKSNNKNKYIESKAGYTSNGNYTTQLEDQLGNKTTYAYDTAKGTTSKITDANGNVINYTYDGLDRLNKVSMTNGSQTYQNQYTYENDRLKAITHNGFNYSFVYDTFGNQKQVKIGDITLITNNYDARNGNLNNSVYGNNHKISYTYDRFDRITKKTGTTGSYSYAYDGRGNVKTVTDEVNNDTATYTYDLANRLVKEVHTNGYTAEYVYDKNNNVYKIRDIIDGEKKVILYNYDLNNNVNSIRLYNATEIMNYHDRLLRMIGKQIKTKANQTYKTEFGYTDVGSKNKTTTQIKSMKNGTDAPLNYTYDKTGNITTISEGEEQKHKYYYDSLNQLIREDAKDRNMTITYSYDVGGNILSKTIYPYTTGDTLPEKVETVNYSYGNTNWKDQLTSYNGKAITYDAIGNPLTYDGNTYTWQNGRQLGEISNEANNLNIAYKYNDSGIRTEKTVNGVITKYYLNGSKVIYEKTGDNITYYIYDENGNIIGMRYNTEQYYYKKNLQGDIIGILDSKLEEVVKYSYDSWGNTISITNGEGEPITDENHIGHINVYRYRGYRYDKETGLYYLQSRYYNPQWGRFINADGLLSTGKNLIGMNLYTYCENNPINKTDSSGQFGIWNALQNVGKWITGIGRIIQDIGMETRTTVDIEERRPVIESPFIKAFKGTKSTTTFNKSNKKITAYKDIGDKSLGIKTNTSKVNVDVNINNERKVTSTGSICTKHGEISLGSSIGFLNSSATFSWKSVKTDAEVYITIDINKMNIALAAVAPELAGRALNSSNQQYKYNPRYELQY